MHDSAVLALSVSLPIPSRISKTRTDRRGLSWPFLYLGGYEVYFGHTLVDVWHEEPGGADSGTVCRDRRLWTHVRHLRLRYPMLRDLRRRLFTTCEWCGELGSRRHPVNISHGWGGDERDGKAPWWVGDRARYHRECSTVADANQRCVCETPSLAPVMPGGSLIQRSCVRCRNSIDSRQAEFREARIAARKAGRGHRRPSREDSERVTALFLAAREGNDD